jgi:GTP-binding protein
MMKSSYITSAQKAEQLPKFPHPEVAFVGRSNVGKSSLLNAILGRKKLAFASNTPGRTQMVNFFSVEKGARTMILADLPGYGYSATGKGARKDWVHLMEGYLRRGVQRYLFLLDARRAFPANPEDLDLLRDLTTRGAVDGVTVVLTKADKLNTSEMQKTLKGFQETLAEAGIRATDVIAVSTLKEKTLKNLKESVLAPLEDAEAADAETDDVAPD